VKSFLHQLVQSVKGYGTGYARANQLGLRALGVVYFAAFVSYLVQAQGLIGANGVLPFAEWMQMIRPQVEAAGYRHVPTLLWWWPSDAGLHAALWAGVVFSVLLAAGIAPLLSTAALWALYLSVTVVGRVFWGFQWDNLLLEAGLLAILAAPWRWRMRWRAPDEPPRLAVFLFHWLVFRLMFLSGFVKLASRDAAWWDLTALTYHYWTQPLPVWTAWYANLLPVWAHKLCCLAMFGIELGLPFLIFLGGRARAFAAAGFVGLMLLIAATGNYTFFNLLTAVLCLWLVRDERWAALRTFVAARMPLRQGGGVQVGRGHTRSATASTGSAAAHAGDGGMAHGWRRVAQWWVWAPGLVVALLSLALFVGALRLPVRWPAAVGRLADAAAPFRSVNNYGLFAVMTTSRPEIVLEGTWDGQRWFEYEFRWKPGDISLRPRLVAPHQPRLDWQMWFAALGTREGNPWLMNLMVRLLQNEPDALALLAFNPFEQKPPYQVRAVRYSYRFTTRAERAALGTWWVREFKDLYCPPIQLNPSP